MAPAQAVHIVLKRLFKNLDHTALRPQPRWWCQRVRKEDPAVRTVLFAFYIFRTRQPICDLRAPLPLQNLTIHMWSWDSGKVLLSFSERFVFPMSNYVCMYVCMYVRMYIYPCVCGDRDIVWPDRAEGQRSGDRLPAGGLPRLAECGFRILCFQFALWRGPINLSGCFSGCWVSK